MQMAATPETRTHGYPTDSANTGQISPKCHIWRAGVSVEVVTVDRTRGVGWPTATGAEPTIGRVID